MLLWSSVGVVASALVLLYVGRMSIRTDNVPTLASLKTMGTVWSSVQYSAFLLLAIDVVRRVTGITTPSHAARISGCVAVSLSMLMLPQYLFFRGLSSRIAALESPQDLDALVAFHGKNNYWRCLSADEDGELRTNLGRIRGDLDRYGLSTDGRRESGYCGDERRALSVTGPSRVRLHYHLGLFQGRLDAIAAAQRSEPFNRAVPWQVGTSGGWQVPAVPVVLAILIGLVPLAAGRRLPFGGVRYPWRGPRWPSRGARLDEFLASRWPALWWSRAHIAAPQLAIAAVLLVSLDAYSNRPAWLLEIGLALMAGMLLQTQSQVRRLAASLPQELGVILFQAAVLIVAFRLAALMMFDRFTDDYWEPLCWIGLVVATVLQCARNNSAVLTSASVFLAVAFGLGLRLLMQQVPEGKSVVAFSILVIVLAYFSNWTAAQPTLQRGLIGMSLILAPAVGGFSVYVMSSEERPILALVMGAAGLAVTLWATKGRRDALTHSAR